MSIGNISQVEFDIGPNDVNDGYQPNNPNPFVPIQAPNRQNEMEIEWIKKGEGSVC